MNWSRCRYGLVGIKMIDLALNASACERKMSMRDYEGQYYVCILEPRAVFHFLVAHDYSTEGP